MGIKPTFKMTDVHSYIDQEVQRIEQVIINQLSYIGEEFVRDVRTKIQATPAYRASLRGITARPKVRITASTPRYGDDTANLSASTGFGITKNGKLLKLNFKGGGVGEEMGRMFILELSKKFPYGLALIVVSGMEYAAAVESLGYDVLTGSSFKAEESLLKMKENLNKVKK